MSSFTRVLVRVAQTKGEVYGLIFLFNTFISLHIVERTRSLSSD